MRAALDWQAKTQDPRLSLTMRVVAWAMANSDVRGIAHAWPGQLRAAVELPGTPLKPTHISRALRQAEEHGWLAPGSSAWRVVLADARPPGSVPGAPPRSTPPTPLNGGTLPRQRREAS